MRTSKNNYEFNDENQDRMVTRTVGRLEDRDNGGPEQWKGQGQEEKGGLGQSRTQDKRRKIMGEGQRQEENKKIRRIGTK
jgi:hypothetical protein